jgi:hypothetical protein
MVSVELPPGVECLEFVVGGDHSGDVRLYADLCGRFWFEATATVAASGRVAFAVPYPRQGTGIARFRITPIRVSTSSTVTSLYVKTISFIQSRGTVGAIEEQADKE